MSNKIKRPPAVWLTQLMLAIFTLLWLAIIVLTVKTIQERGRGTLILSGLLMIVGLIALLLVSQWALAKRKQYGRWLGLLSLVLEWTFIVRTEVTRAEWPQERGHLIFVVILHGLLHAFILTLIFRLALAGRVREFFRRDIEAL